MEINSIFNLYVENKKMAIDGQRYHAIFRKLVYVFQNKENTFGSFSLFTFG